MSNTVPHNLVANKVDNYLNAQRSESGNFIGIKLPWLKHRKWVATPKYHQFRNDIIEAARSIKESEL